MRAPCRSSRAVWWSRRRRCRQSFRSTTSLSSPVMSSIPSPQPCSPCHSRHWWQLPCGVTMHAKLLRVLHLRACALKLFSFHLFNPCFRSPQTWMRQDCCGCQSTLLQLHRRGNLPRTKYEAVCLPVSQAFAGVSTS